MLGISSVYYSKQIDDGARLLDELAALGFDGIELEYRVRPETLRQMGRRPGREIPVFSVHAFFPNPVAVGEKGSGANAFLFSSPERQERDSAVRHGIATLERPSGSARGRSCCISDGSLSSRSCLRNTGGLSAPRGSRRRSCWRRSPRCWRPGSACASRTSMLCCAPSIGSTARRCVAGCCWASRTVFTRTIPLHAEVGLILGEFAGGAVRYWHDVGHALNHQRLGVGTQDAWLEAYGTRLAGTHLHDIRGARTTWRRGPARPTSRRSCATCGGRDQDPGDPPEVPREELCRHATSCVPWDFEAATPSGRDHPRPARDGTIRHNEIPEGVGALHPAPPGTSHRGLSRVSCCGGRDLAVSDHRRNG